MITVRLPLVVQPAHHGTWQVAFWLGEPFDAAIPFRSVLGEIARVLGPTAFLDLPPFVEAEDFIDGRLVADGMELDVYFEHALGYLALSSSHHAPLVDLITRLRPHVAVAGGGRLPVA